MLQNDWSQVNGDNAIIRASAVLTTSYVAATVISNAEGFNQLVLYVDFTIGSLTTAEMKVEFSDDGTTYYDEISETITAGTATALPLVHAVGATGKKRYMIPIKDKYIKVSVKGTGTVTGSLMAIKAFLGNV